MMGGACNARATRQEKGKDGGDEALVANACRLIKEAKGKGAKLLVLTGAGMSMLSGVPVFRMADGSMTEEFTAFLAGYNKARQAAGLEEATDWFDFSVAEMFRRETEKEAWHYWRWRLLRAQVEPGADYTHLQKLVSYFGTAASFVITSNCDTLHAKAGMPQDGIEEIHGALSHLQCASACTQKLTDVGPDFIERLKNEPDWVPRCPDCTACLRPNVMIFSDDKFVDARLLPQTFKRNAFCSAAPDAGAVVLEIGAGKVVATIHYLAEAFARTSPCFVRINPDAAGPSTSEYIPLRMTSCEGLQALCAGLGLI